jgi:LPXTG-motif cell wall-anchored protein
MKNNPMKNNPFYWAGFVINGDVSPIISSNYWMIFLGIGFGILILMIVFWKKRHFNTINKFYLLPK